MFKMYFRRLFKDSYTELNDLRNAISELIIIIIMFILLPLIFIITCILTLYDYIIQVLDLERNY